MNVSRDDDFATLTTVASEFEANIMVAALRENGIESRSFIAGLHPYIGSGSVISSAQIVVRKNDLERAGELLESLRPESVDIDWSEIDVGKSESPAPAPQRRRRRRDRVFRFVAIGILLSIALAIGLDLFGNLINLVMNLLS